MRITRLLCALSVSVAVFAITATPGPAMADRIVGVYFGNEPASVAPFEEWFGKPIGGILAYGNQDSNWTAFNDSISWGVGLWKRSDRRILWSIPLIVREANLEQAAAGKYNAYYRKAALAINASRPDDAEVYIRTGWEFNGNWMPWASRGKEAAFKGAYKQFVKTFRSVSPRFKFVWSPNIGWNNPANSYPGDAYVDIIGMDAYYNTTWDSHNGTTAFNDKKTVRYGFNWHKEFAELHNKPMAYPEWGINSDSPEYIQMMDDWCLSNNVVYQTYWNSDASFRGKLSHYPNAMAKYKEVFSKW